MFFICAGFWGFGVILTCPLFSDYVNLLSLGAPVSRYAAFVIGVFLVGWWKVVVNLLVSYHVVAANLSERAEMEKKRSNVRFAKKRKDFGTIFLLINFSIILWGELLED